MAFEITERWLSEIAGWQVAKPAKSLASSGAVLKADFDGRVLRGLVMDGRKRLACGLKIEGASDVTNLCSCRDARSTGAICAHSTAVGLAFLKQAASRQKQDQASEVQRPNSLQDSTVDIGVSCLAPVFDAEWARALKKGRLVVNLAGTAVGGAVENLGNVADASIGKALTEMGETIVRDRVTVQSDRAGKLFAAVVVHPAFRCGDRAVRVSTAPGRLRVRIGREGDHQIAVELVTKGEAVVFGDDYWWWSPGVFDADALLMPLNVPLEFVGLLRTRRLVLPESTFVRLGEPFFDAFEESLDSDASLIAACRGIVGTPEIILKIEGSLRALDAWLRFEYPEGPIVELGADVSRQFPYQNAAGIRVRRNDEREMQALGQLRESGFEFGRESLQMKGEENILRFLSNDLVALKKRWHVKLGERFEHVSKAVSLVQPKVEWEAGSTGGAGAGEDWLEFGVSYAAEDGTDISSAEIQRMLRVGQSKLEQPNGKKAIISLQGADEWNATLQEAGVQMVGDRIRIPAKQAAFVAASLQDLGAVVPDGFAGKAMLNFQISSELIEILRDYQEEGVRWLARRAVAHGGAILGDEMGLGKTLQTLALLSGLRASPVHSESEDGSPPRFLALVVCPASLLWNWEAEIAKFLPDNKTFVLHGTSRAKLFRKLNECDIAITTYALAVRDLAKWAEVPLDAIVLDEASYLRNPDTKVSKAVRTLTKSANVRVALTGTPIENGVKDLWSIMECVVPGYLGSRNDFKERYEKPLASTVGLSLSDLRRLTERLNRRIRPFFLRRTKNVVAKELPSKIESVQLVELSSVQAQIYRGISREAASQMQDTAKAGNAGAARMHMLTALLRLRQVCCDPRLVSDQTAEADSAKLEALQELMERLVADGHSVLVFSQFVSMLSIIRNKFDGSGIGYCYLDGASSDRKEQVASFQSEREKRAFLISLKAGGYGLNLTKADVVIHYDPWWNPAVEAQATDRAHRIGQTRPVTVYKLIARSSVEEKIMRLQRQKRDVMDAALDDQQPMMRGLTDDDLASLLKID